MMVEVKWPKNIELTVAEATEFLSRIQNRRMTDEDINLIAEVIKFMLWLFERIKSFQITTHKLRKMIFGRKTEKMKKSKPPAESEFSAGGNSLSPSSEQEKKEGLSPTEEIESPAEFNKSSDTQLSSSKDKPRGHGRMGANVYVPDETVMVPYASLKAGDACPMNCGGQVYLFNEPGVMIRIKGQAPAHVTRIELERYRCSSCGALYTAPLPLQYGREKYDAYFKALLVIQKYFMASPFYRQEHYQRLLGVPLPDATQWELVESVANCAYPVFGALESMAANGKQVRNDDTNVKILSLMGAHKLDPFLKRTGMYTTCIFAEASEHKICLYYSGGKHSGENLSHVLKKRDKDLPPVIQMCDALPANIPKDIKTLICYCLTHARRNFYDIEPFFQQAVSHVIEQLALVYKHDAECKEEKMSDEKRLEYHKTHSAPVMETLKGWMQEQFDSRQVEPNSALGSAIRYMQKHWVGLTRFLSVEGAPLDNNIVERALKLAIRIRKNAMSWTLTKSSQFILTESGHPTAQYSRDRDRARTQHDL